METEKRYICPSCEKPINYDDAFHQKCNYCGNENFLRAKTESGPQVPYTDGLSAEDIDLIKGHYDRCMWNAEA